MVWQSIPSQLSRKNKKFIYGAVREGARAKDFEMAIQWLVDAGLEIDFLAQYQGIITPIEVKAEENLRSKSLRAFIDKHQELQAIRFSMSPYRNQEWMTNIPLYAVEEGF